METLQDTDIQTDQASVSDDVDENQDNIEDMLANSDDDSLTFSNGVIEKIVAIAAREVPGVLGMKGGWVHRFTETFGAKDPGKGVTIEVADDNGIYINMSVLIAYGIYAPDVFDATKRAVVQQVTSMTGLEVKGVRMRIEDVLTPEEYEASRRAHKAYTDHVQQSDQIETMLDSEA